MYYCHTISCLGSVDIFLMTDCLQCHPSWLPEHIWVPGQDRRDPQEENGPLEGPVVDTVDVSAANQVLIADYNYTREVINISIKNI